MKIKRPRIDVREWKFIKSLGFELLIGPLSARLEAQYQDRLGYGNKTVNQITDGEEVTTSISVKTTNEDALDGMIWLLPKIVFGVRGDDAKWEDDEPINFETEADVFAEQVSGMDKPFGEILLEAKGVAGRVTEETEKN